MSNINDELNSMADELNQMMDDGIIPTLDDLVTALVSTAMIKVIAQEYPEDTTLNNVADRLMGITHRLQGLYEGGQS